MGLVWRVGGLGRATVTRLRLKTAGVSWGHAKCGGGAAACEKRAPFSATIAKFSRAFFPSFRRLWDWHLSQLQEGVGAIAVGGG